MNQNSNKRPSADTLAALRHLEQASQLLSATSPALSAFLGSEKAALSSAYNIPREGNGTSKTCSACNSILIPGWSCSTSRSRTLPRKEKRGSEKHINGQSVTADKNQMVYECSKCHCKNKFNVTSHRPKAARRKSEMPVSGESIIQAPAPSVKPTIPSELSSTHKAVSEKEADRAETSATIKKRSRKTKHGGLQALLAKSKSESTSKSGFDLMDFMKSG